MPIEVKMPDLGTAVDEIRIVKWLVQEGEPLKRGAPLVEIETDKAASELESVAEGVLLKWVATEGSTVASGAVIAYVGQPGEAVAPPPAREAPKIAPVVLNLAKKLAVDLSTVQGTGENGMVTRDDVLRASKLAGPAAAPVGEELSRAQAAVARAVLKSVQEIPHLRISAVIDMSAVENLRAKQKIGYDAVFLKAMAGAMQAVPAMAAKLEGQRLVRPTAIRIALAVGFDNELQLPVVHDVDQKDLATLQQEVDALVAGAKTGVLKLDAIGEASMSLSNLGMYPIESFDAIIFPGQSAILSVGAVRQRPLVCDHRVDMKPVVTVKLAADHRFINGRLAAQFLTKVKELVEAGAL